MFQTIVHPTDFDEPSKEAFQVARSLAQALGARLVVLHVVAPPAIVADDGRHVIDPKHPDTIDGATQVTVEDAYNYALRVAREEGIFVGPSSGAARAAVEQKLPDIPDGSTVMTFCYDTGERYFSVEGLFESDGTAVQVGAKGLRSP